MTVEAPPKYASVSTHAHERLIWARMAARLTPDVSGMRAMPCHARTVPCQRTTGSSMGKSDGIIMASLSACAERRRAVQAIQVVEDDGCERFMACSDMLPAWRPVAAGSGARQRRQERAARSRTDAISSEGADSPLRQQRDSATVGHANARFADVHVIADERGSATSAAAREPAFPQDGSSEAAIRASYEAELLEMEVEFDR